MRRQTIRWAGLILAFFASTASSQQAPSEAVKTEEFGEARALLQAARETIIRDEFRFTEQQERDFWPVYDKYRSDVSLIRDRQAEIVVAYLEAYRDGVIPEGQAKSFVDDYLDLKMDLLKVQRKHLRQFRNVLPPRMVARFYQLENKLDAELEVELARVVPLMDPV